MNSDRAAMNLDLVKGMKRLMVVMNNNPDNCCPICGDAFSSASQYRPVWSDHYDNIVCVDCHESQIRSDMSGLA